jgi:hypothetical protein
MLRPTCRAKIVAKPRTMSKLRRKRFYYRNGRIHTETRALDGKFHGPVRTWHRNGQLTEELSYRHGLMHGISRQWDEDGRSLGSFAMKEGTGTQRYWHDNGRLKMEIDSRNGKFHGRTRIWLRDGTLVQEYFNIQNNPVSRATYLKLARDNPEWPQYKGQPAGRVVHHSTALEHKELELLIESILEKSHAEARQWLNAEKLPRHRSIARFRTTNSALKFVERLYAAGAEAVLAAPIFKGKRGKEYADWLLVRLPKAGSRRRTLQNTCQNFCRKHGGAMLPDKDIGESHLFLRLE